MKCFYHSADLDGHCAGEIVRRRYPDCQMIGIDYYDAIDLGQIAPEETVFMVDFSAREEVMRHIAGRAKLIWIDHHKTAMDMATSAGLTWIDGLRRIGTGACALVHEFLYPGTPVPKFIRLLAAYDVWDHSDAECLPLQYGVRLERDTRPGASIWNVLWSGKPLVGQIIASGRTALAYEDQHSAAYARTYAFDVEWEGLRWVALNRLMCSSRAFDAVNAPGKYDGLILFGWKPGRMEITTDSHQIPVSHWRAGAWKVSLYAASQDIDASAIAKRYGGGGHAGAAGFSCAELPFPLG